MIISGRKRSNLDLNEKNHFASSNPKIHFLIHIIFYSFKSKFYLISLEKSNGYTAWHKILMHSQNHRPLQCG